MPLLQEKPQENSVPLEGRTDEPMPSGCRESGFRRRIVFISSAERILPLKTVVSRETFLPTADSLRQSAS